MEQISWYAPQKQSGFSQKKEKKLSEISPTNVCHFCLYHITKTPDERGILFICPVDFQQLGESTSKSTETVLETCGGQAP